PPPGPVAARANALVARIAAATGGALDPFPTRPPSLARGAAIYSEQCLQCHGPTGRGDGPKAKQLEGPAPASLADAQLMRNASPVDVYRKVTIGVAGTAMPGFARMRDRESAAKVVAFRRVLPTAERQRYVASPAAATFSTVRRQVDSAVALRSSQLAFDAYLTFEQVETEVRARNPALAGELEDAFAALRARAAARAGPEELDAIHARLLSGLERAERLVADRGSAANLFMESFVLLLREGFEAILIVAALMTFLAKAGAGERRRHVAQGAWAAVAASVVTAVVVELLFEIAPGQRERL